MSNRQELEITTAFAGIVTFAVIVVKLTKEMLRAIHPRAVRTTCAAKRKKHKEHFEEIRKRKKELKDNIYQIE